MEVLEFWIVRHGRTNANAANRIQGQSDTPLDETGREEIRKTAAYLQNIAFDRVYCSDLERARESAEIIAPHWKLQPMRELREWNLGEWQGKSFRELKESNPEDVQKFLACDPLFRVPGGESMGECRTRVGAALDWISTEHKSGKILIVSHFGVIRMIFSHLLGLGPMRRAPMVRNGSCSRFSRTDGVWQLISWNETAFL